MSKRANGLGGVTFHKPSGRWRARITIDGRQYARTAATQSDGWRLLDALKRQGAAGLDMRADRVTVAEFLTRWLDEVAALRVRPSTMAGYRQHVRDHLTPAIGRHTLAKLGAGHIQKMFKALASAGLSPMTLRHIRSTLRKALNDAERQGMIGQNVARLVELPAVTSEPPEAISPERAWAILEAVKGHPMEALMTVALLTGLRQGELLGLPWDAVDLAAGLVTVRQSLSRRGRDFVLTEPKTRKSRRTVHLPALAVASLQAHGERQRFKELAAGDAWQNSAGLVFVGGVGRPLHGSTAWRALATCLAAAGLPPMRFHDLRHAFATLALQASSSLREVQEGLGHSSIATTANIYAHVTPATMRKRADDVEALIMAAAKGAENGGG